MRAMKRTLTLAVLASVLSAAGSASADEVGLAGGTALRGIVLGEGEAGKRVALLLPGGDVLKVAAGDVKLVKRTADAPTGGQHMRYVEPTEAKAGGLDVAVTTWIDPKGGPRVDLVGAVHIADLRYYHRVQRRLDRTDVTLYEAVIPEGSTAADLEASLKKPDDKPNPVRSLQQRLAKWLGLSFQLGSVDYTRPHFVHADMTVPAEQAEGASDMIPAPLRMVIGFLEMVGPLLDRLFADGETLTPLGKTMKRRLASMLGTMDVQEALGGMGAKMKTQILDERNAIVLEHIKKQRMRPEVASIAVFYGAAHMEGIETDLKKLGYTRGGAEWLRAWSVD